MLFRFLVCSDGKQILVTDPGRAFYTLLSMSCRYLLSE